MMEGFYFELVEPADIPSDESGRYIVVRHLWDVTVGRPSITDPQILDSAEKLAHALEMVNTDIGLPGWEGQLESPADSLAWFVENGFYVFEVLDGKGLPREESNVSRLARRLWKKD